MSKGFEGTKGPLPEGAVAWLDMGKGEAELQFNKRTDSNRTSQKKSAELFAKVPPGYHPLYLHDESTGLTPRQLAEQRAELLEALKSLEHHFCLLGPGMNKEERHSSRLAIIAARSAIANATQHRNAPAPVAGDAVAKLPEVWRRRATQEDEDGELYVEQIDAARLNICSDELKDALAQDRASQAGAAVPDAVRALPEKWRKLAEGFYNGTDIGNAEAACLRVTADELQAVLATQPPAAGVDVSEEMVERACAECWGSDWGTWTGYQADSKRAKARRILHAALRTGEGA